jgi:hypothetical protein
MDKDKDLDNIFKNGLQGPDHFSYKEDDWDAMEKMMNKGKKRLVVIYWLPILGSVAALLLLFIGWWLLKPVTTQSQKNQQTAVITKRTQTVSETDQLKNIGKSGGTIPLVAVNGQNAVPPAHANNLNTSGRNLNSKLFLTKIADGRRRDTTGDDKLNKTDRTNTYLLAFNPNPVFEPGDLNNREINALEISHEAVEKPFEQLSDHIKGKFIHKNNTQFALNLFASSDLNGVNSLQQSKVGDNFGVLFSVSVFKKFTISTGAVYSAKPYITGFGNYHTSYHFKNEPLSVQADCLMLDIPLNIDYQIYNHYQNKISIGTGLSSYLMLYESYKYNYAAYTNGPAGYNVSNPGKYFFSTLNLQATYQRQINSKFGVTIEPYIKLPLTTVGASQVRLQSTGVAVGLSWNLNTMGKH